MSDAAIEHTPAAEDAPLETGEPGSEPRPPLVVSPVYVFRLIVGLVLVLVSSIALLVFEQALIGLRQDIADIQANWPEWLEIAIEIAIGVPIFVAIIGTNIYLLYKRKYRRWIMINLAALGAIMLGAIVTESILAFASDALSDVVDETATGSLGNDGLASTIAVLTVGSVWIGPRLRPWVIGFVTAVRQHLASEGSASEMCC